MLTHWVLCQDEDESDDEADEKPRLCQRTVDLAFEQYEKAKPNTKKAYRPSQWLYRVRRGLCLRPTL
jgi:hypothetical protein